MRLMRRVIGSAVTAVVVATIGWAAISVWAGETSPAAAESEPEFIELHYWEGVLLAGLSRTVEPLEDCDTSAPDLQVCEYETEFDSVTTHLGLAHDESTGTITTVFSESCVGTGGAIGSPTITEGAGTIEAAWGDRVFFRNRRENCSTGGPPGPGYFVIDGGTGRFQDASGTVSTVNPVLDSGFLSIGVGTLRVRADLWDPLLPAPIESAVITPGVAAVGEGDAGETTVEVPVSLSYPLTQSVTVDWVTTDTGAPGVATADVDYVAASGTVTFASGETSQMVSITVNGDTAVEPPLLYGEWGLIQFSNPSSSATLTADLDGQGVFIIVDDD